MAAVKEWLSTEEVCSGDGDHTSRKGDGWGRGQLSICCDQLNVNIINNFKDQTRERHHRRWRHRRQVSITPIVVRTRKK